MLKSPLTYLQKHFQACMTILMRGQRHVVLFCVRGCTGFEIHLVIYCGGVFMRIVFSKIIELIFGLHQRSAQSYVTILLETFSLTHLSDEY